MKEFYFASRGSKMYILFLVEHWYVIEELQRRLNLPEPGLLMVPSQDVEICKKVRERGIKVALDNGAFQLLKTDFDKPLLLKDLAIERWLRKWSKAVASCEWNWVALLDVPVHGKNFVEREERIRRILLTAELHRQSYKIAKNLIDPKRLRVVAQGFEVNEYEMSAIVNLQNVEEHDDVLAVGSVCVRKPRTLLGGGKARGTAHELEDLMKSKVIRDEFKGLHFFGLHGKIIKKLMNNDFMYSTDTGAAGLVFKFEIKEIKKELGVKWNDRKKDYVLAHAVQYLRSTLMKTNYEVLADVIEQI